MWSIGFCVASLLSIYLIHLALRWMISKRTEILPPGSMGLPLIGETLSTFFSSHSIDVHPFLKKRFRKYGPIFKTRILGRSVVVSADPIFNNFLFLEEGNSVELWYSDSFSKLFNLDGESRTNAAGSVHRYVRGLILNQFGTESIKKKLLPQFEEMVYKSLSSWSRESSIEVKHSTSMMIFNFIAEQMFGYDPEKSPKLISEKLTNYLEVLMSFPLNIPGTKFHKCMKVRTKVMNMIRDKLKEKRASPELQHRDLLDQAMEDMKTEKFLKEDFIVQIMFSILFTSIESISSILTLAIQLLAENPSAREELKAEHLAVLRKREKLESTLAWNEYKSMPFTHLVIRETLRLANSSPGILRRAMKDINVNGYTIPAGWTIMIASSAQQLDPSTYVNPLEFNPWRWKDLDSNEISKNFMPFGGGIRQCAGAEYSKALMSTFLFVLVTKFRWELVRASNISRNPFLNFGDGVHIKIAKKQ